MTAPLAAITGATGLLGRVVVRRLLADGWRVRMLVRGKLPLTLPEGAEAVPGSLEDYGSLRRFAAGAAAVVHAAEMVKARRAADFHAVNVEGSHRLGLAVHEAAPLARVVVVSSLAARVPWLSPYALSKADGEDALVKASSGHSWLVLRPSALYGPGDRATLPLFRAAAGPWLPVPRRADARLALLHVEDAAAAVVLACSTRSRGVVWELGEGGYSWVAIAEALARAVRSQARVVTVPPSALTVVAALLRPLTSGLSSPLLAPGKLAEVLHDDWTCRPERMPPPSLWRPRWDLEKGLAATAAWYRANRWL
ncbi:MAG: NAD(P)-dependent oxidoreductase [Magnetospirillum sp.]|nr:NAD(P)-dependent oxidoreductase [Magnetospirillum sp.]